MTTLNAQMPDQIAAAGARAAEAVAGLVDAVNRDHTETGFDEGQVGRVATAINTSFMRLFPGLGSLSGNQARSMAKAAILAMASDEED